MVRRERCSCYDKPRALPRPLGRTDFVLTINPINRIFWYLPSHPPVFSVNQDSSVLPKIFFWHEMRTHENSWSAKKSSSVFLCRSRFLPVHNWTKKAHHFIFTKRLPKVHTIQFSTPWEQYNCKHVRSRRRHRPISLSNGGSHHLCHLLFRRCICQQH